MYPTTFNKLSISLIGSLLISGCSPQVENAVSRDYQAIYPMANEVPSKLPDGSIYSTQAAGLFATDRRASKIGDILTVSFAESFQATKSQNAATSKSSANQISLPGIIPG